MVASPCSEPFAPEVCVGSWRAQPCTMTAVGSRHFRLMTRLCEAIGGGCSCFSGVYAKPGKEEADANMREAVEDVVNNLPEDAVVTRKMIEASYQNKFGAFKSVDERSRVLHTFHIIYKDTLFSSKNGTASRRRRGQRPRLRKHETNESDVTREGLRSDAPRSSADDESEACLQS